VLYNNRLDGGLSEAVIIRVTPMERGLFPARQRPAPDSYVIEARATGNSAGGLAARQAAHDQDVSRHVEQGLGVGAGAGCVPSA
jgi:hypothetical protein